jgi:hypothetical protein
VSAPSSEGSVPSNWLLATALRAAATACTASEHSPPAAAPLLHGTSGTGTHSIVSAAIAPSSEGSVPSNRLLSTILRAAAACTASEHSPPAAASLSHGTSQRGTRNLLSAVSAPSSEGSVPPNVLLPKFLRAAAGAPSAQSFRRRLPQSMAPHRWALTTSPAP